jgi:hypothetical protein
METNKILGIWLDHSSANLIALNPKNDSHVITSKFTSDIKEEALNKSEKGMHNKRQQMQEAYYKEIGIEILKYDHVLLFGPTSAKTEPHNYLVQDSHFEDIEIDIASADKMTSNEKISFVKSHFEQ